MPDDEALIHFHPIYSGLHCGAKTGIYHTNEKDINCPFCLANLPGPREILVTEHSISMLNTLMLDKNVVKGHWGDESLEKLLRHLDEEVEEFKAALWGFTTSRMPHSRVVEEGSDVSNVIAMIVDNLKPKQ